MKTTWDLPPDLVMEVKLKAARENRKMKDIAADALRAWLKPNNVHDEDAEKEARLQRRLDAIKRLGPVDEAQREALNAYIVEYREDRETAFDRTQW